MRFVLEVQEEAADLIFGNLIGRRLAVVGQLSDRAEILVMRAFTDARQMQIIAHPLVKWAGNELGKCHASSPC